MRLFPKKINEDGNDRFSDGSRLTIGGVITRRQNKTLKNGATMCVVTIEDRYGEMDAVAFQKTLDQCGGLLIADAAVALTGKLSCKEGQKPELLIYSVTSLVGAPAPARTPEKPKRLFLRVRSLEDDACHTALSMLVRFPGSTEVVLYDSSSGNYLAASGRNAELCEALLSSLERHLGRENVIVK